MICVVPFSTWSLRRILLLCAGWILAAPLLAALGIVIAGLVLDKLSARHGTSFSISLNGWSMFLPLFAPPVLLFAGWLWARRGVGTMAERDRSA
jgi:hypothetical protein